MVKRIGYILIFFWCLGNPIHAQSDLVSEVLISLKQLRFEKARTQVKSNPNNIQGKDLELLIELFSLNGYREDNAQTIRSYSSDTTNTSTAVQYLNAGYQALWVDNNRVLALDHFTQALESAQDSNQDEMTKNALYGIFKVKQAGYSLPGKDYLDYIERFKKLRSDQTDNFWCHYFSITLMDITLRYGETLTQENQHFYLQQLDQLNSTLPQGNTRLAFYVKKESADYFVDYDYNKAYELFEEAEELMEPIPFFDSYRFRLKVDKALVLSKMGKNRDAIDTLKRNKLLTQKGNSMTNQLNYNFFLSEFYGDIQLADSALYHMKELFALRLQSDHAKINEQVSALEVELEAEKKEKQLLQQRQKTRENRNLLFGVIVLLIIVTGVAVLIQKNTSKKKQLAEQEALLKQERVDNLLKEQELISIDAMIAGQEKERKKVAGELHDDLGSLMATIKLHFDNAKVDKKDPGLKNAQKLLDEAYQKIRGIAHNKNSGVMSDQGLLLAVEKLASTISNSGELQVEVNGYGLGDRMENSMELAIFRMIQELVTNAIKHAEASHISILLTQHEDNLNIIVEDNGKGFELGELKDKEAGMGLTTIEKRVEHLEGAFTIDSVVGSGSSIIIDLPV